jgi:arylsulfatase A-like enzyme
VTGFLLWAVLATYLHLLLEWLFFATKPSFLEALSASEGVGVLLAAPLLPAGLVLGAAAVLWPLHGLVPAAALVLARALLAGVLTCCAFILIDNFTYTLFGVGVVSTAGPARFAYLALLLVLFAWSYRAFPLARVRARWAAIVAGGMLAASTVAALLQLATSPSPPTLGRGQAASGRRLPHIIVVGGDGVNAARTSVYGYRRPTTPFLERLAETSLVFENAFPNVNSSAGSVASVLTGKDPLRTGLLVHPDILTGVDAYQHLPAILKGLGYRSIHVSTRLYTDPFEENMQHAFDVANFREHGGALRLPALPGRVALAYAPALYFLGEVQGRLKERMLHAAGMRTMTNALTELRSGTGVSDPARIDAVLDFFDRADGPVFAQLHLMGTHIPLAPRRPVFSAGPRPATASQHDIDILDDTVADFDRDVERIVTHLERSGKLQHTVLVVMSDHGWLWSYARLPLLFRFPGGEPRGRRVENAQLIDVAPTLLDYLGLPVPAWMDGASLLEPLDPMRPIVTVTVPIRPTPDGPFRRIDALALTLCERVLWLNPRTGTLGEQTVAGYAHPCPRMLPYDARTVAWTTLVGALRENGYDVSSLPEDPPLPVVRPPSVPRWKPSRRKASAAGDDGPRECVGFPCRSAPSS